jgi:hypothetical protein
VLRVKLTRDHLSAISGMTSEGRLFMQMHGRAYKAEDVVRFLRLHLTQSLRQAVGDLGWSPIHQAEVIKKFLADGAAASRTLPRLRS